MAGQLYQFAIKGQSLKFLFTQFFVVICNNSISGCNKVSDQKSAIQKIEVYFRNIFVMLSPILLSLIIAMAIVHYLNHQNDLFKQNRLRTWQEKAEITLASIRTSFTFPDLFTAYGNKMSEEIETAGTEAYSGDMIKRSLKKSFPADFELNTSEIWAFKVSNQRASFIRDTELAGSRFRIMERVVNSLIEFSSNPLITQTRIQILEKQTKAVLGQHAAPLQLGKNREGRLTPVTFEGNPHYIYWRLFRKENIIFGAVIILIPASRVESADFAMKHVAKSSFEDSQRRIALAFVPAQSYKKEMPVILPEQFASVPVEHEKILALLKKIQSSPENHDSSFEAISGKAQMLDGFIFLRDFTTVNVPYDAVVFAPLPEGIVSHGIKMPPVLVTVLASWVLIFAVFYIRTGRIGLPLALSFRLLFLLTGLLPIMLMTASGTLIINNSYANAQIELRQENLRKLSGILERSDNLARLFGRNIAALISDLKLHPLLISQNPDDIRRAFEILRNAMQARELSLDNLYLLQPGGLSLFLVKDQRLQHKAQISFNLFGPAAHKVNRQYSTLMPIDDIKLDTAQKNYLQIFGGFTSNFLEEIFMHTYEKENALTFGDSSYDYYYSTILSKDNRIRSYLIFSANSESLFRIFLSRELDSMNFSESALFLAAEELINSEFTIFPFKKLNALNSRSGKMVLNFLRRCRSSVFARHFSDSENLYLFFPMSKMPKYAAGCIVSLSKIKREKELKQLFLFSSAVLMICLMYILAAYASGYLLKPLDEINKSLSLISTGDLSSRLIIDRRDELGTLSHILMRMQDGLKARQLIGKFVSTTFDKSLEKSENLQEFGKARKFQGTIVFSDIRSFTTHSESNPPSEIAEMLNVHMEQISEVIQARGGQIEQFIGDAIVAFFPDNEPFDSLSKALDASLAMSEQHSKINHHRQKSGLFVYETGIGLSHGELIAGPVLTEERSEFILLGDAKTEAEECEQKSKKGKFSRIIVTEKIFKLLSENRNFSFIAVEQGFYEIVAKGSAA